MMGNDRRWYFLNVSRHSSSALNAPRGRAVCSGGSVRYHSDDPWPVRSSDGVRCLCRAGAEALGCPVGETSAAFSTVCSCTASPPVVDASIFTRLSSFCSSTAVLLGAGDLGRRDRPLRTTAEAWQSRPSRRHRSQAVSAVRPMHRLLAREQPMHAWPYGAEARRWPDTPAPGAVEEEEAALTPPAEEGSIPWLERVGKGKGTHGQKRRVADGIWS